MTPTIGNNSARSFDGEGIPRQRVNLVENGVPRNLVYPPRASAKKRPGPNPLATVSLSPNEYGEAPMNLVFSGGDSSLEKNGRQHRSRTAGHPASGTFAKLILTKKS